MVMFQSTKSLLEVLLFVSCIVGMVFLGAELTLQRHFNDLTVSLISLNNQHINSNRDIKKINRRLHELTLIERDHITWTPILARVFETVPNGITLDALELDATKKMLLFAGIANTRDDLLLFQESLQSLTDCATLCIQSANLPEGILTQREKISFTLTATTGSL